MQNQEVIVQTLLISAIITAFLVLCIAYMLYYNNKKQFILHTLYEKEVIKAQMEIQESTFMHVSQEIHDNIAQQIVLAKFQLASNASSLQEFQTIINGVDGILSNSLSEIRSLSKNLNSNFVTENGLWHSIQNYIEQVQKSGYISVSINEEGTVKDLDNQTEIMLFRIVQESVTNILKHSKANRIVINFNFKQESLELSIEDNGIGFDVPDTLNNTYKKGSSGLQNIIKRTGMINATCNITSKKDKGTLLCITTPC